MSNPYELAYGSHANPNDGRCAMEWVAYLAGEPHSDSPQCVSPVLRTFGISLNDRMPREWRQKLRPYLARMIGTAGDRHDPERVYVLQDWTVRTVVAKAFEVANLDDEAQRLRTLAPVVDAATVSAANAAADVARRAAVRAGDGGGAEAVLAAAAANAAQHGKRATASHSAVAAAAHAANAAMYVQLPSIWQSALETLDKLLPTEAIDLPTDIAERAAMVCGV